MNPGTRTKAVPASARSSASLGEALAALAARECRAIARALARSRDRHRAIHQARKSIRRLRAILDLGRSAFGDARAPLDRSLQQLARGLSSLRDAHVVVGVAHALADGDSDSPWNGVADRLQARRDALLAKALQKDPAFARRRARILALGHALAAGPWHAVKRKAVCKALARTERRAAKAQQRTHEHGNAGRLHRWRRRVRWLRLQCDALRKIDGTLIATAKQGRASGRKLKRRADALGRLQDLTVLGRCLPMVTDANERPQLRTRLRHATAAARDAG